MFSGTKSPAQSDETSQNLRSMVFSGSKETTQDKSEAKNQVIVTAATRYGAQVIQQNDECAKDE